MRDENRTTDRVVVSDAEESIESPEPSVVDVVVVHETDLVAAVEARDRNRRPAVLRITPPFAARMRARLHVDRTDDSGRNPATETADQRPIHVPPRALIEDVPPFPGQDPSAWRDRVADAVRDRVDTQRVSQLADPRIVVLGE